MTKTKIAFPIRIHPAYLAELRQRIETGPGFGAVADAAGVSKTTLWRVLHAANREPVTVDAVERARRGLEFLEEGSAPMPPPIVSLQGSAHHAWNALGERLLAEEPELLAGAVDDPDALVEWMRQRARGRAR